MVSVESDYMFYNSKTKTQIRYIKKHEKIIKHFKSLNPRTKRNIQWVQIKVEREPVRVLSTNVRSTHIYDSPAKDYGNPKKYLDSLDYDNTHNDFIAYRKKLGLMPTKLIIEKRKQYHLTQDQMAKVLKINPVQYKAIERGSLRFEKEWYSKLYLLMNPKKMKKLIK